MDTSTINAADLPPTGASLAMAFDEQESMVLGLAFDPRRTILASAGNDFSVKLWDLGGGRPPLILQEGDPGKRIRANLQSHFVKFDASGSILASTTQEGLRAWNAQTGDPLPDFTQPGVVACMAFGGDGTVLAVARAHGIELLDARGTVLAEFALRLPDIEVVALDPSGQFLAYAGGSFGMQILDTRERKVIHKGPKSRSSIYAMAFSPISGELVTSDADRTLKFWDPRRRGLLLRTLEGHTDLIDAIAFSNDGRFLASKSNDGAVAIWDCMRWEMADRIRAHKVRRAWIPALAFHPTQLRIASVHVDDAYGGSGSLYSQRIEVWDLDAEKLGRQAAPLALGRLPAVPAPPPASAIHHTTAKIVVLGDHSVGKSALCHRLMHGVFKEQLSTHGQQFWVYPALGQRRTDGTECEAILWDFAGQPDYRLVHALFVDNADLALVLFDSSNLHDPLHGVHFWLKQLQVGQSRCRVLLVCAQVDRGTSPLMNEELQAFCRKEGIAGPVYTSAYTGTGIDDLVERMKSLVPWDDKAATVTTVTFKRIKDFVLGLKATSTSDRAVVTAGELRARLEATDAAWEFTDAQMLTAVEHLENYGYVRSLRTSTGEPRILLQPDCLNNLASSFVLEARRNPKGLGALEEKRLLGGGYDFAELTDLAAADRDVLLDSAVRLFLQHNVCFRETDPLRREPYLVFPELINLKKPIDEQAALQDGVAYTASGPTENVFASLVVLLGYTHTFTRTAQWNNNARYEIGDGLLCGFRQDAERDGELDFVLCFGANVGSSARTLFQGLFESFLARRNLTVLRYEPVICSACGHPLDRTIVRKRLKEGKTFGFCNECGERLSLPSMAEPIQLSREMQDEVESQQLAAEHRTRFEQAIFSLRTYVVEQGLTTPECFISYAWGTPSHERWVEKRLAVDLQNAGIEVILDRWHNAQIGASVSRFVERIAAAGRIVVVGTRDYHRKYVNEDTATGYVVAAEVDLISNRLLGTEEQKMSVLPLLVEGDETSSLPPLLHGRVRADYREESSYFRTTFDLLLSLYRIPPHHPAVADLRESLDASRGH